MLISTLDTCKEGTENFAFIQDLMEDVSPTQVLLSHHEAQRENSFFSTLPVGDTRSEVLRDFLSMHIVRNIRAPHAYDNQTSKRDREKYNRLPITYV